MAKDFSSKQPAPQSRTSTQFGPDTSGVPEQCCDNCEPQKLGSESIANFSTGPGVAPSTRKIH